MQSIKYKINYNPPISRAIKRKLSGSPEIFLQKDNLSIMPLKIIEFYVKQNIMKHRGVNETRRNDFLYKNRV